MGGPVRAFERWGTCHRCGWVGGLDGDICILCQADPALTEEPATMPAHVAFQLARQCVVCGRDHDRYGELCDRCQERTE